ncbi:MAG: glycosyltransferase [Thermoanaerobaculia bacterium]
MRILHVVPTYLPATRYGGPIHAVHGLCRSLAQRGHEVDVVTTNIDGSGRSPVPLGKAVNLDGVQVHYFEPAPLPFARRLFFSSSMRGWLRGHAREYDIAHLHSVFLAPTWAAARAASRADLPYVISPRGMLVPELIDRKSRLLKRAWIAAVEQQTFAHAAAVHFTARQEWDDAVRTKIFLPAPFVVPNGTDLPPLDLLSRRTSKILFLGRINWKKGIDLLIDAMALLPEVRLIVAGNDEESLLVTLREQAQRNGTLERIEFAGPVSGAAKQTLLQTAAALILPSHSENFGNVVLEAMAASTPVIVSRNVGLAEDVERSRAGIVTTNVPVELAAAIRDLLANDRWRTEMGARGRALVQEAFTWAAVAARMEQHYDRIIGTTRSARG